MASIDYNVTTSDGFYVPDGCPKLKGQNNKRYPNQPASSLGTRYLICTINKQRKTMKKQKISQSKPSYDC